MDPQRPRPTERTLGDHSIGLVAGLVANPFTRYLIVGGIGYLVCIATYAIGVYGLGLDEYLAIIPAFVTNTASNFMLNRTWTFEGSADRSAHGDAWRYLVVAFACLGCNYVAFYVLYTLLGLPDVLAQAIAIVLVVPVGFVGSRYWAFSPR